MLDFLIVGAPKCGTTSLYNYLEQHPEIFLPEQKELNFFADDLFPDYLREADYRRLFQPARAGQLVGEASVWYLFSRTAARNIRHFAPKARIIIMLRNPVEMLYSLHSQHYFQGMEHEEDFRRALQRDPASVSPLLDYRAIADYATQIERFRQSFPAQQIHIILQQDLKADAQNVVRETFSLLGVAPDFEAEIRVHNANKVSRSGALRRLSQLPPGVLQPLRKLLPFGLRRRLVQTVTSLNRKVAPRPPLDPVLAEQLRRELSPKVKRLEEMLGRELKDWTA